MIIAIIFGVVYIGYFASEAISKWRRNRIIEKYEKSHPEEVQDHNKFKIIEPELTERQIKYREYLNSPHWQRMREVALNRAGHKCQICGCTHNLKVHHNTYDRRGHEALTDLVVLCGRCHSKFHNKYN